MRRKIHIVILILFIVSFPIGYVCELKEKREAHCRYCCSSFEGKIDRLDFKYRSTRNILIDGKWIKLYINADSDLLRKGQEIIKNAGDCRTFVIDNGKKIDITSVVMKRHIGNECFCE